MTSTFTDGTYLRSEQYRDASNLNARIELHRRFSTNAGDWQRWVFDHLLAALGPEAHVLEAGCGPAELWRSNLDRLPPGWQVTLSDFSEGMVEAARAAVAPRADQFAFVVADVQALPFADAGFDAVVANHMLYHVPNRTEAIGELCRVMQPGGTLFAATNGDQHLIEIQDLLARAEASEGWWRANAPVEFTLQNGAAQLVERFDTVTLDPYEDGLVVTETEPLVDYLLSTAAKRSLAEAQIARVRATIEAEVAAQGAVRISKESGLFIAKKAE